MEAVTAESEGHYHIKYRPAPSFSNHSINDRRNYSWKNEKFGYVFEVRVFFCLDPVDQRICVGPVVCISLHIWTTFPCVFAVVCFTISWFHRICQNTQMSRMKNYISL